MAGAKGRDAAAAAIKDAQQKVRRRARVADPPAGQPMRLDGEDVRPGGWIEAGLAEPDGLPPNCPVKVLGLDGDVLYVIDAAGQLAEITDHAFGQTKVQRLFLDRMDYLYWAFPRWGKGNTLSGFDTVAVRDSFYKAAGRRGLWSAGDKVRGLGGWTDRAGNLVLHCGDTLYVKGREIPTGEYEGHFYPRRPPIPEPWAAPVTDDQMDETNLWAALQSFTFERPDVDAMLVVGWLAAAYLGGALSWRPMLFLVGDKGVGKSSAQGLIKAVLGDALHQTADTTPAGIYQKVRQDSLAVAVDELESGADNSRVLAVVKLARLAASGGVMFRGGANHSGTSFTARNCFFMSAINHPPVPPQDLSRMAILNLRPRSIARSAETMPVIDTGTVGRMVLRRVMDAWPQFSELYHRYRAALAKGGHDGRGQDTYGTLLTCAHLVLGDALLDRYGLPTDADETLHRWGSMLAAADLPEHEDAAENWRRCLMHLLTSRVEAWRSGLRHTVGGLMEDLDNGHLTANEANTQLAQADLLAIPANKIRGGALGWALAIPNAGPMISGMFRGSDWGGEGGTGVWSSALRQGPPSVIVTDKTHNRQRINGVQRRCTIVMVKELG